MHPYISPNLRTHGWQWRVAMVLLLVGMLAAGVLMLGRYVFKAVEAGM